MRDSLLRKLFMILIIVMAVVVVKLQGAVEEKRMNQYVERCLDRTLSVFSMGEDMGDEAHKNENGEDKQGAQSEGFDKNGNAGDPQGTAPY